MHDLPGEYLRKVGREEVVDEEEPQDTAHGASQDTIKYLGPRVVAQVDPEGRERGGGSLLSPRLSA